MKTKLTLTVRKTIIDRAKRQSKRTGKSISQMFEDLFEGREHRNIKSEQQRSAERLLARLESTKSIKSKNDKSLLLEHVARKFA